MVAVLTVDFYLEDARSLKDKRRIVKSITEKIRVKFRQSAIESDYQDIHKSAQIATAWLVDSRKSGDKISEALLNFIEENTDGQIVSVNLEYR